MSSSGYEPILDHAATPPSPEEDVLAVLPATLSAPPPNEKWLAIIGLCLCSIGVLTDGSIITVGIPSISSDIQLMKHLGWSSSAFLLMACVGQPLFGRLYGQGLRKNPLIFGVFFYHLGTTICGFAPSLAVFIFGRAISGVGAASLYVGSSAVIVSLMPAEDVALCLSIFSFVAFLCGIVLPVIGGAVIDFYSWRPIFFLSLPLSLVGLVFLWHAFGSERVDRIEAMWWKRFNKVDFTGTVFLLMAFACLLAPVGSESGVWASAKLLGFGASIFGFGTLQYRYASLATIAPEVFAKRHVWLSSIVVFLLEMAIFTHLFYLALFYQAVKNFTAKASGLQETMYMAALASASLASGAAVRRFGRHILWLGVSTAVFATAALPLVGLTPHRSIVSWLPFTLGSALGAGGSLQLPFGIVASSLEGNERIAANSIIVFSHSLGGPVGTLLAHMIFSAELLRGLQNDAPELDARAVISMGIPQLRTNVPERFLETVLRVYCQAITRVLLIPVVALAGATVCVISMSPGRLISLFVKMSNHFGA